MASAAPAHAQETVHKGLVLAIACLGMFMVVLDVAIVTVALPAMREDLRFSSSGLQWVVNAYTLTYAGFLLLGGRAADLYGRRRVFLTGLGLFCLASLAGGLASGPAMLVAARAFQGLGGAVLSPATLTIVTTTFTEPRERARALGLWSAALASGGATGALIGGILTDYLSWRWIFLINLPIGLAGFVATRAVLPESRGELSSRSLDIAGALTITGGLTALVFGVVRTETYGWTAPTTLVSLAVAAVLVVTFVVIESRIARSPLAPLGLFRSRALTGANLAMLCVGGSMFAMWYFVSLYLQGPLGMDPLHGGLAFLPASVAVIVGAQLSGRLVPKTGARPLLAVAALLLCGGLIWMSRLDAGGGYASDILGPLIVVAFGLGLSFPPGTYAATAGVPPRDAGLASGIVNSTRQLGGAVGLAALATVAAGRTSSLLAGAPRHPPSLINHALAAGYSRAFEVAAVIALGACVAALSIPGRVRARAAQPATPAPTAPGD